MPRVGRPCAHICARRDRCWGRCWRSRCSTLQASMSTGSTCWRSPRSTSNCTNPVSTCSGSTRSAPWFARRGRRCSPSAASRTRTSRGELSPPVQRTGRSSTPPNRVSSTAIRARAGGGCRDAERSPRRRAGTAAVGRSRPAGAVAAGGLDTLHPARCWSGSSRPPSRPAAARAPNRWRCGR